MGIAGLVVCAILLFVAWERYQDNANKVAAANRMMQSSPLSGMMGELTGGAKMEPGMPTATKYALVFAIISGIGGAGGLIVGMRKRPQGA
jgi:hypothetical protein